MEQNTDTKNKHRSSESALNNLVSPEYGQVVTATKGLRRKWESRQRGHRQCGYKLWVETEKTVKGIFLGTRTLQNGWRQFEEDEGYIFIRDNTFEAALISPGPRLNPVYVPLNSIEG
jgi:hypothetical protein